VDDIDLCITHIVRGEDLLGSAPRQMLIYGAMGLESGVPAYLHLPLIVGPDARKLAKRHGDTRLCQLRAQGVTAGQVRAMLARWSGIEITRDEISIDEWAAKFDLARLPRAPVTYDDAHQRPRGLRGEA
jgi:glutamyl-tRNA synthetase